LLQKALGHDLPNQLVAIQGMARLLDMEEGDRLGADGKDYLNRLTAATQRAHEMVRSLADFIRAMRAAGVVSRLSLGDMVREVAAELGRLFPARVIECDLPEQGPYLAMPPVVLRQMVMHLIRYRLQSDVSADQSPIRLETRETPAGTEFRISDRGRPLTPEDRLCLCETIASGNSGESGRGLGMVMACQLVENCGATLAVESDDGQGTVMTVCFPRNDWIPPAKAGGKTIVG
jgi:signal transduction histidine kinase